MFAGVEDGLAAGVGDSGESDWEGLEWAGSNSEVKGNWLEDSNSGGWLEGSTEDCESSVGSYNGSYRSSWLSPS